MRVKVETKALVATIGFGFVAMGSCLLLVGWAQGEARAARVQAPVSVEACPYGAVRMVRSSQWICLTAGDAQAIAEGCYKAGASCVVETPLSHDVHGDEAPDCVLEDVSGAWKTVREIGSDR
jgi:hypothetical protein